mgnify:CR=1 FL=1
MTDTYKPLRIVSDLPRSSLLHPDREYVPAVRTDIRATFAKARAEQQRDRTPNVQPMQRRAKS